MLHGVRKLGLLALLLSVAAGIGACDDTLRGFGQDAEEIGDEVEDET